MRDLSVPSITSQSLTIILIKVRLHENIVVIHLSGTPQRARLPRGDFPLKRKRRKELSPERPTVNSRGETNERVEIA